MDFLDLLAEQIYRIIYGKKWRITVYKGKLHIQNVEPIIWENHLYLFIPYKAEVGCSNQWINIWYPKPETLLHRIVSIAKERCTYICEDKIYYCGS